jgi:hypothetical protein
LLAEFGTAASEFLWATEIVIGRKVGVLSERGKRENEPETEGEAEQ